MRRRREVFTSYDGAFTDCTACECAETVCSAHDNRWLQGRVEYDRIVVQYKTHLEVPALYIYVPARIPLVSTYNIDRITLIPFIELESTFLPLPNHRN